ncbi:MAG: CAP domain-containing protein [Deltaproteobacteria bacterium]|nr:CAP domain-containing protein [Deltaproteobacteria bacterium]
MERGPEQCPRFGRRALAAFFGLTIALFAACAPSPGPVPPVEDFGDEPIGFAISAAEKELGERIETVGERRAGAPMRETVLCAVARNLAHEVVSNGIDRIDNLTTERIGEKMREMGSVDNAFRSYVFNELTLERAAAQLETMIDDELHEKHHTHYGVGAVRTWWPPGYMVGVLLVRKGVQIEPVKRRMNVGEDLFVQGRLLNGSEPVTLWVQGPVETRTMDLTFNYEGRFSRMIRLSDNGRYHVEIMTTTANGPEVAALFEVVAGRESATPRTTRPRPTPLAQPLVTPEGMRARLIELVNDERAREGVLPVGEDSSLNAVAQRYAEEILQNRRVVHVSPDSGDLVDRAKAVGIDFVKISENIAVNRNVDVVHEDLMRSPSHRRNIVDDQVDRIGVGVAIDPDGGHVYVVENFARLRSP